MKNEKQGQAVVLPGVVANVVANEGEALVDAEAKQRDLAPFVRDPTGKYMTSEEGLRISNTDDSLKAGARGPTLMEDLHFREKLTHFDHERIPERVVHARGSAAHGYFQSYAALPDLSAARFLNDPARRTPVFVRFSTVIGSRGSADTVRDVRGFAVRFYTDEGNFDLVGNNIPVFFIQDGIKFPDVIHAAKPEPHNEIPGASTAHDTFYDFISLTPESMHMILWVFSDRAIPRSYRMMEGFGVHTFRLVNQAGRARFVKFHWKPLLGIHSLVWDEAQKIAGKDPEFHRRDLWESIEAGHFPEWELGVQVIEPEDEHAFAFDLLDATKLVPEELVPVQPIGKMVLNRNPDEFFAETEQVAFHLGNVVPGIDFTNDPLLQARLFSYLDTQLLRLGGPNFTHIPINRPLGQVHNNNRGGFSKQTIHQGRVTYSPNALAGGCPMMAPQAQGGYVHHMEKVEGHKIRQRSESFGDHFSQATMFWNSLSAPERDHVVQAAHFELGRVQSTEIRRRMVGLFAQVDSELAQRIAVGIGVTPDAVASTMTSPPPSGAAEGQAEAPGRKLAAASEAVREAAAEVVETMKEKFATRRSVAQSPALSQLSAPRGAVATRRVAVLLANGYREDELALVTQGLRDAGANVELVARFLSPLRGDSGGTVIPMQNHLTASSVLYDAVYVPGGSASASALRADGDMIHFVAEAFKHCKPIAATSEGIAVLSHACPPGDALASVSGTASADPGLITADRASAAFLAAFLRAIAQHRHWDRQQGAAQLTSA